MFHFARQFPELVIKFSERTDGSMVIPKDGSDATLAVAHRKRFLDTMHILPESIVAARIQHGTVVQRVDDLDSGKMFQEADGLMTTTPNLALSVTGADCFPLYYFDPTTKSIALVHAGWRGILKGIQTTAVERMRQDVHTLPADVRIGIGPGICAQHFVIQKDVLDQFAPYADFITTADATHWYVDLRGILKKTLQSMGVRADHIEESGACTYEHPETYFSYRRDKTLPVEAGMAVMMRRK